MSSGVLHYDWVSLEGTGRNWQRTGEETATLVVNVAGSTVEARDTLATLTPEARQFVEYLWLENETPQTACDRMGLIFVDPGKMLKEIQQLIRSAII